MDKKVLVPVAKGFEEIEALTAVDILRRAGASVVLAGLEGKGAVEGRSNISVMPDKSLDDALAEAPYDLIALPGGLPNAYTLRDDARLQKAIRAQAERGGLVAAICAAPVALAAAGVLEGKTKTSHPAMKDEMPSDGYREDRVVVDGKVITSRGPGTAMEFAFALVRALYDDAKVEEVNGPVFARL
jgi:4-methyl-5(b-hydroxyethyl)-thiazole monophosphate biosynthesis